MKLRKITSLITALSLLAGSLTALPASAADQPLKGDIDNNGVVDIADAILMAQYNAEKLINPLSAQGIANSDLDGNNKTDGTDLTMLLEHLAGLRNLNPGEQNAEFRSQNLLDGIQAVQAEGIEADDAFKSSQLDLALNILKQNCAEKKDQNVLISPLSIALALSMTANGANGTTLKEMENVLGGGISISKLNDYYAGWLRSIAGEKEQKLFAADAIWFRDDKNMIDIPKEFLQTCADYYGADAYKAPFDNSTVDDINAWVNENTHEMIHKILNYDDVDADTVMVLANALAFEALWSEPYEDYQVRSADFRCSDGAFTGVEMMYSTEHTYLEDANATGFLKWYEGGKYAFAAVLPPSDKTVDEYLESLDGDGLKALLDSRTGEYDVNAFLPKFKYDFGNSLKNTLIELGMPTAFGVGTEQQDFTGLNTVPEADTYIGDVLHKTFIDVCESGTKAAAVTAVIMKNESCAAPNEEKTVRLDRPFVYMILDMKNELPVFIGTVKHIGEENILVPDAAEKSAQ